MGLILTIDVLAVGILVFVAFTRGLERALPVAAFLLLLFPNESQIPLPGLFDLTTQRLLIVVLFLLYFIPGIGPKGNERRKDLPLKSLMLLQMAWMVISAANSAVFTVSIKSVLSQMLDFFLLYYIIAKTVSRVETIHKIVSALVAAMVLLSVFGAVEAYRGWSIISLFPYTPHRFSSGVYGMVTDRGIRATATFPHAILFGCALALAIPLALYLVSVTKSSGRRVLLWIGILLMFMNIYKTASRGPWLALTLSLVLMLVFSRSRIRRYLLVIGLLTATVLVVRPGVLDTFHNMYSATLDPESPQGESYQWRYALYNLAGRELAKDFRRALWGYGPESFFYLGLTGNFQGRIVAYDTCDSSLAELMIETGYIGFLITAFLLLKPAVVAFRNFRRMAEPTNSLNLVLFTNIAAYCFMMTNVACYGWGQQNYFLWAAMALVMVYPRLVTAQAPEQGTQVAEPLEVINGFATVAGV